jgi:S1-C subfamily serine protease
VSTIGVSSRRAYVSVWAVVVLVILAAVVGGFLSYAVLGKGQPVVAASTTTVTQTSVSTSFVGSNSNTNVTQTSVVTSVSTSFVGSNSNSSSSSSGQSTAGGVDTVKLYRTSSQSVVTVSGFVTTTVLTNSGPQNVTAEVLGSGFVTNHGDSNYVVTNFHVVHSATNITVTFQDGSAYPVAVMGTDPYSDLAVLNIGSVPSSELHPLTISSSTALKVGEPVVAIGNPFGLSGSMTVGIVSQLGRTITEATAGNFSIADAVQFSAPINPGNSGGPLLSGNGTVVGITTATVNGAQGVGFAIPSDAIIREIGPLISTGRYDLHPYIGIAGADMNYELSRYQGTNATYGVLLEMVVPGGPAAKAGLMAGTKQVTLADQPYLIGGDIIISINGTRVVSNDALASYLQEHAVPGTILNVGIVRSGSMTTIHLVVGTRPPPPSS